MILLVIRYGSYLIIVILIIPALTLSSEWKQQELLISLVHQKRNMDYITPLSMGMVTPKHILVSKIYMVQLNLLRSLSQCVSHHQKRVGSRYRNLKKKTIGLGVKGKLTNTKIGTMENYLCVALRFNVGNFVATK